LDDHALDALKRGFMNVHGFMSVHGFGSRFCRQLCGVEPQRTLALAIPASDDPNLRTRTAAEP
jgi:hypothetical protein